MYAAIAGICRSLKADMPRMFCFALLPPLLVGGLSTALYGDDKATTFPVILSLETAQRRALMDNPSLHAVEARVRQAAERVKQARAAFLPSMDAEWSAAHTRLPDRTVNETRQGIQSGLFSSLLRTTQQPVISPLYTASAFANAAAESSRAYEAVPESMDNYAINLNLGYLLFSGFARKHRYAMARFGAHESAAGADEARRLLLEAVAQAYHGAQLSRERVTIAQADKAFNTRLLEEARARHRVGATALSEVLNFEVRMRASQSQLINAEQDLYLAKVAVAALMGIDNAAWPASTKLEVLAPASEEGCILPHFDTSLERAFALRPDLEATRQATKRTEAYVGVQQAQYYPSVAAFLSKEASRTNSGRFESDDFSTTVGVSLSYNLFTGGRRRAEVSEARQMYKESEYQLQHAEITVAREVRQALAQLDAARQQVTLQQENADYVEQNRDMTEKEFQAGQASLALLNQAQRDLVEAQATLALARVSLLSARHALHTATAETLTAFTNDGSKESDDIAPSAPGHRERE